MNFGVFHVVALAFPILIYCFDLGSATLDFDRLAKNLAEDNLAKNDFISKLQQKSAEWINHLI